MKTSDAIRYIIEPGLLHLPWRMDSTPARAMLIAMALQESRFTHRRQIRGPARGWWQFEQGGGVAGVLRHSATREHAWAALDRLQYPRDSQAVYEAIEHNDGLATVFARLLLFTVPHALPGPNDVDEAWDQYIWAWRPGKPHRHTWDDFYRQAWEALQ